MCCSSRRCFAASVCLRVAPLLVPLLVEGATAVVLEPAEALVVTGVDSLEVDMGVGASSTAVTGRDGGSPDPPGINVWIVSVINDTARSSSENPPCADDTEALVLSAGTTGSGAGEPCALDTGNVAGTDIPALIFLFFWLLSTSRRRLSSLSLSSTPASAPATSRPAFSSGSLTAVDAALGAGAPIPSSALPRAIRSSRSLCRATSERLAKLGPLGAFFIARGSSGGGGVLRIVVVVGGVSSSPGAGGDAAGGARRSDKGAKGVGRGEDAARGVGGGGVGVGVGSAEECDEDHDRAVTEEVGAPISNAGLGGGGSGSGYVNVLVALAGVSRSISSFVSANDGVGGGRESGGSGTGKETVPPLLLGGADGVGATP